MNDRDRVGNDILNEGGRHMDDRNYHQAIDAYKKMERSTAPENFKEMARKFIKQAERLIDIQRGS
jgi:hypothetical protein